MIHIINMQFANTIFVETVPWNLFYKIFKISDRFRPGGPWIPA